MISLCDFVGCFIAWFKYENLIIDIDGNWIHIVYNSDILGTLLLNSEP